MTVTLYMPPADLSEMAAKADLILDVTIGTCRPYLTEDESAVFSDCPLTIHRVLKGPEELTTLVVRRIGGELRVDGAPFVVLESGFPAFQIGERYVLFLARYQGTHVVVHAANGAFRVTDGKVRQVHDGTWNDEHADMTVDEFVALVQSKIR